MKIYKFPAFFVLFVLLFSISIFGQKMKPEEVIAKHLDSIGNEETRTSTKSIIAVGDVTFKSIAQKNLSAQGRGVMSSTGEKNFIGINLNASDYSSDKFSYDGKKVKATIFQSGQRSPLGAFLISTDALLQESLVGGTLSTSWALHNLSDKKAKVSYKGLKKIDGNEVHVLSYSPRKGDLDVQMFFEKDSFRHVRTEYSRIISASMGKTIDQSARQSESRLKVIEDFSDFKTVNGRTMPHNYRILYSISGQNGTTEIEWAFNLTEFAFNQTLDDNTFDADIK